MAARLTKKAHRFQIVDTVDGYKLGWYSDYGMTWAVARHRADYTGHQIDDDKRMATVKPEE